MQMSVATRHLYASTSGIEHNRQIGHVQVIVRTENRHIFDKQVQFLIQFIKICILFLNI